MSGAAPSLRRRPWWVRWLDRIMWDVELDQADDGRLRLWVRCLGETHLSVAVAAEWIEARRPLLRAHPRGGVALALPRSRGGFFLVPAAAADRVVDALLGAADAAARTRDALPALVHPTPEAATTTAAAVAQPAVAQPAAPNAPNAPAPPRGPAN